MKRTELPREWGNPANHRLLEYLNCHGGDLAFTKFFWKQCEQNQAELVQYAKYAEVIREFARGGDLPSISQKAKAGPWSVRKWTRNQQKPKLAHYLAAFLNLGEPRSGWVWLTVNNTPGHAVPLGPFVQVPEVATDWSQIAVVLSQITPLESRPDLTREYMFGFLLGMVIGDSAKSRTGLWHRHIGLELSRRYSTNERIGEFTSLCARNFGLRMHRVRDTRGGPRKPHDFYTWVSQASALVDWIFNIGLGLKDGEKTTYDPVRMNWAYDAPVEFRKGLVQGIAESDGSVSIASQTVEFWIGPNWDFVKRLLSTFGVRSFRSREALSVTRKQVMKLNDIPVFSPFLRTVRYQRFKRLVAGKHIEHGRRIPKEVRLAIRQARIGGLSLPQISEQILRDFGLVLTFEAVQRWAEREQSMSDKT